MSYWLLIVLEYIVYSSKPIATLMAPVKLSLKAKQNRVSWKGTCKGDGAGREVQR